MASGFYPASTSMAATPVDLSSRPFLSKHTVATLLHAARLLLALIILCLDAYAIHFSGDLAMVYSLILVCNHPRYLLD